MQQRQAVAVERPVNTAGQVLFASLIGTTIEFFDFYIYATAAVLVFPRLFFPHPTRRRPRSRRWRRLRSRLSPGPSGRRSSAISAIASAARRRWWRRCSRWASRPWRSACCRPTRRSASPRPAAVALPLRPGARARRRMGRRRAARRRERAARQARVVRHVPAARRADRLLLFRRRVPAPVASSSPTISSLPSAGGSLSWPAPRWCWSASTCG